MQDPFIPRRFVLLLVAAAVILPVAICVFLAVVALLEGMGDLLGGAVLGRVALAGGIVWVIDLVCLVLALAIGALGGPDKPDGQE